MLTLPKAPKSSSARPVQAVREELDFVFTEVRKKAAANWSLMATRRPLAGTLARRVGGHRHGRGHRSGDRGTQPREAVKAAIAANLLVGDGLMQIQIVKGASKTDSERFYKGLCSPRTTSFTAASNRVLHVQQSGKCLPHVRRPGVHKITHPELLVPDPKRSIRAAAS